MHMAIGKTYGVKRTVWIEVRSENKSWYYDNSLLIYFHFPLPLRASCMAGVVSNATQLSKPICTNSARRPQQENGSWHKRGIGLKASFRIKWNATRLAQKSTTILFITSGMRTTRCNNLCTQSPGDPNEAITWKANIVKRLCLKL